MHLAKRLEYRVVAVMACDDEVIPFQERKEAVGDGAFHARMKEAGLSLTKIAKAIGSDLIINRNPVYRRTRPARAQVRARVTP
jgi:hypothetical protein